MVNMLTKVGVVGVGAVGQACAFALMLRGSAREVVLVDRSAERATGVATDMRYGAPLSPAVDIMSGNWGDLAGAGVVLICAGVNEKRAARRIATMGVGGCGCSSRTLRSTATWSRASRPPHPMPCSSPSRTRSTRSPT